MANKTVLLLCFYCIALTVGVIGLDIRVVLVERRVEKVEHDVATLTKALNDLADASKDNSKAIDNTRSVLILAQSGTEPH